MGAYNKDVMFIHIPKCGGWSCKHYMVGHLADVLLPQMPEAKMPIGHIRLQDIERFTGRAPDSFQRIIAVVRNPYEQQLSQWQFWRDRYAKGDIKHPHNIVAATYARLTEFLQDSMCDFHVWYEQHYGFKPGQTTQEQDIARAVLTLAPDGQNRYENFGGMFRYWLTVDGEIPDNVHIVRQEELDTAFPEAIKPFTDKELGPMPRLNTSPHGKNIKAYYTPLACKLVEDKCKWAFNNYYEKWLWSGLAT